MAKAAVVAVASQDVAAAAGLIAIADAVGVSVVAVDAEAFLPLSFSPAALVVNMAAVAADPAAVICALADTDAAQDVDADADRVANALAVVVDAQSVDAVALRMSTHDAVVVASAAVDPDACLITSALEVVADTAAVDALAARTAMPLAAVDAEHAVEPAPSTLLVATNDSSPSVAPLSSIRFAPLSSKRIEAILHLYLHR